MNDFCKIVYELATKIENLPSRKETLEKCVEEKLLFSDTMYKEQIEESKKYLLSRDNLKVVKTIARENKKKGV